MASSTVNENNFRGSTDRTPSNNVNASSPSRLLTSTNGIRNDLISRNLYTPNRIYPITDKTQAQNVINAISGIASLIAPFKGYDLSNTIYGRLIDVQTPLTVISLAMLGRQFAFNSGSYIAKNNFPVIKVANLFDGSKNTHLFTPAVNFEITPKPTVSNFQQFLNAVIYYYPAKDYPFKPTSTNADFITHTGPGQLTFLYTAMNQNVYKEGFSTSPNDIALTQSSEAVELPLTRRSAIIGNDHSQLLQYQNYFNFFNTNPYSNIQPKSASVNQANGDMVDALNNTFGPTLADNTQEYAPSQDYVESVLGQSNTNDKGIAISQDSNDWVNSADDEFNDDNKNKLIWGRDGIAQSANDNISNLRGNFTDTGVVATDFPNSKFNAFDGLLEYTRNLLNASEGRIVDQTRKAFVRGKSFAGLDKAVVGFNGSALWVANTSNYAINMGTSNSTGVRQHSTLDQYDRFGKAIRFVGNNAYVGNPYSVIYDWVLPRIHPTVPVNADGVPSNHNLMFSLENLAVRVISNDGVGIIDDEYGSQIPIEEVGQFNGRQMWFPPYNMELNESSVASFDKTVMVGRNEPMYSYQYSERSATLTFTLLSDYPQNLKNQQYQGDNKHRDISEFFEFGGETFSPAPIIQNTNKKIADNNAHKTLITGPTNTAEPDVVPPPPVLIYFPNDTPIVGEENIMIDTMYFDYQYQIEPGSIESNFLVSNGLDEDIYVVTGMTGTPNVDRHFDQSLAPGFSSQYTVGSLQCTLNQMLNSVYATPNNRTLYNINILAGASKLNHDKIVMVNGVPTPYNDALAQRRANAAKYFVQQRLKALFPNDDTSIITITVNNNSDSNANPANSSGTLQEIQNKLEQTATIQERYASITIARNSTQTPKRVAPMSQADTSNLQLLTNDNLALQKVSAKQSSNNISQDIYSDRIKNGDLLIEGGDTAILKGFKSISGNYYYPVFHSQTPEDFHRRLTFLQQCLRQGAAKRYNNPVADANGVLRARNSVFGRQPICVLRIGDFFFTKIIIENLTIDYNETTWDMNPEGFGMQPMIAKVTLQMKVLGGQSLKGPIDALQNAVTFNYYANSNFTNQGLYQLPSTEADNQEKYINGILTTEKTALTTAFDNRQTAIQAATQVGIAVASRIGST